MKPLLATCALFLASCAGHPDALRVDYSARKAYFHGRCYNVTVSGRGTGGRPGSKRTPLGELKIVAKEPHHRFGPVCRIGGVSEDGHRQDDRGVLIHKQFGQTTSGCVGFELDDLYAIYPALHVGMPVYIYN